MALTLEPLSSREFVRHGDHATLDDVFAGEPRPLTLGDVLRAQRAGAQLLDTRSPAEFAAGHLEGSAHIALGEEFASWASTLLARKRPIILVCARGHERETAVRLARVGLQVLGHLGGGIEATKDLMLLVRHPARITSALLRRRLARGRLTLIDVRGESEWRREALGKSRNIPLEHLRERTTEIPPGPVVLYCRTGELSSTAASILEQSGRLNVVDLVGGITAWKASSWSSRAP